MRRAVGALRRARHRRGEQRQLSGARRVARARLFRQGVCGGARPARSQGARRAVVVACAGAAPGRGRRSSGSRGQPARLASDVPDGRFIAVPGLAHGVIAYGCLRLLVARFVAAGSARGLDAGCARAHAPATDSSSASGRARRAPGARPGPLRETRGIPSAATAPRTPTPEATNRAARAPSATSAGEA